jgi:PleD family two-component response regulator
MNLSFTDILIVDDNRPMRTLLNSYLTARGATRLREAQSGPAAMAMMQTRPAELLLLDHSMPGMSGLELARAVRGSSDVRIARTRIVMISGHGDAKLVSDARDTGIDEFLVKPVTMNDLMRRLESAMTSARSFIVADGFTGPDRRRRERTPPEGRDRRVDAFDLD